MTQEINKNYNPKEIEQANYQNWEASGKFACGNTDSKDTYTIMLPPPNVTGTLHMGHGFQMSLMDILIRYNRMSGKDTLWQPGTDHAGIATQMVVERQLNAQGISRHDLGRENFVSKVWEWKELSGGTITSQMRRIGASPDWDRERFTMDKGLSDAVKKCFIKLYEDGLAYRGERLVNWDPKLKTAVSDLEVAQVDKQGSLWHFIYPVADSDEKIIIATTRPETMLGDMAVAVHPEDERYTHLVGKMINLPLTDRQIPIIADDYVEKDFGTGCVKITPAHDFNDYEMGKRHNLPMLNILTDDATLNTNVPSKYQGLDRFEARKQIVADMEALGLLDKIEPHALKVPTGDRTGEILEPYLTKQWFVKADVLAKPAIEAVEKGDVRFVPDNWKNTYFAWMRDIQDWCVSRQLWWGHRIPAWYDEAGNAYVGEDEADVRAKYNLADDIAIKQDEDVFDTWFSSALWPFSTLGWPEQTPELAKYYPTSVLVTGFDIIFFWVARMMMFGMYFMNDVPFRDIYITGLIRDSEGQKMSKSKGNVLDPVDLIDGISLDELLKKRTTGLMQPQMKAKIEKATKKEFPEGISAYGADAVRFTYAALASTSRDISFDTARVEGYRNFCNKLWNASRFVMMNLDDYKVCDNYELGVADKWIWSVLNTATADVHRHLANYRFDLVTNTIYDLVWNNYCDWYVEFAKVALKDDSLSEQQKNGVKYTLTKVLENILALAHPLIPFITESIYQQLKAHLNDAKDTIMDVSYPVTQALEAPEAEKAIVWLQNVVTTLRNMRSEVGIKPSLEISLIVKDVADKDREYLTQTEGFIKALARINNIEFNDNPPTSLSQIVEGLELNIPLAGLVDIEAEKARLDKELDKLKDEVDRVQKKLSNERFVSNAPEAVVAAEQEKLAKYQELYAKTLEKKEALG
ncbi:valine--tRNA ligase [Francisella tularensis subsp. holarctica FSC022]|uniref:valine--tRNA ligase n=1 Tax=Francisella tularensis TaxID=263 RepID=UPI00015D78B3|nr:valine--tRNA ligase [Francisella tularensis]EDO65639.1 valine-tRNA ligase [Francisella tularensis subsp. holarctica FSC022]KIP30813.1 valine--tRNA ligase [Francisella tularensis subsp. holarctica]MCC9172685.1 valine--tRNA ligase [Francisella tularensis]OCQ61486.1 valine--tRNA ligase [Francisella tularensis]OPH23226.1 valine--tRNA ligase [Francisella tularensis subsp. holarctica FSC022]